MKKIFICLMLFFQLSTNAYSSEVQFVTDSSTYVKQATIDTYKQALLEKSREKRKLSMQESITNYLRAAVTEEVHDFSYRYQKKSIQQRALSCEISIASDILARHTGRQITEDFLIDKIDKSAYNQVPKIIDGKKVWGNPNLGFVGNIDRLPDGTKASQWHMTGYGVLERPIAGLYHQFGLETKIITEKSHRVGYSKKDHLVDLLDHLEKGDSVQLWGDYCTRPAFEDTDQKNKCLTLNKDRKLHWYYKDINGNLVSHTGLAGEHAFFLLGYTGNKNNPKKIIVWDSNTGKHSYKTEEWMRKWSMMQYRSLIIYKDEQ